MTETGSQEHESTTNDQHSASSHSHVKLFMMVFGGLCALTILSFGIANSPLMDQPLVGWCSMMAVSCAKAFLVISFFMHLRWETTWKYVLTIPASVMSILLALMLVPDIMLRFDKYTHQRKTHAAEPVHHSVDHSDESSED